MWHFMIPDVHESRYKVDWGLSEGAWGEECFAWQAPIQSPRDKAITVWANPSVDRGTVVIYFFSFDVTMENERVQTLGRRVGFERFFGDPDEGLRVMDMEEEIEKEDEREGDNGSRTER